MYTKEEFLAGFQSAITNQAIRLNEEQINLINEFIMSRNFPQSAAFSRDSFYERFGNWFQTRQDENHADALFYIGVFHRIFEDLPIRQNQNRNLRQDPINVEELQNPAEIAQLDDARDLQSPAQNQGQNQGRNPRNQEGGPARNQGQNSGQNNRRGLYARDLPYLARNLRHRPQRRNQIQEPYAAALPIYVRRAMRRQNVVMAMSDALHELNDRQGARQNPNFNQNQGEQVMTSNSYENTFNLRLSSQDGAPEGKIGYFYLREDLVQNPEEGRKKNAEQLKKDFGSGGPAR